MSASVTDTMPLGGSTVGDTSSSTLITADRKADTDDAILGCDLRNPTAKSIRDELIAAEDEVISIYSREVPTIESIWDDVRACDAVLDRMQQSFGSFQQSITTLYSDIRQLQRESGELRTHLTNRATVAGPIVGYVSQAELSAGTIKLLLEGNINAQYVLALQEFSDRLTFLRSPEAGRLQHGAPYKAAVEGLCLAVSRRLQTFMSRLIVNQRRVEGRQTRDVDLLPHADVFVFLDRHCPPVADLLASVYTDIMKKVYTTSFTAYTKSLVDAVTPPGPPGLLGAPAPRTATRRRGVTNIAEALSLDGRRDVLRNVGSPDAVVGGAPQSTLFERAFSSALMLLAQMTVAEYVFVWEFFANTRSGITLDTVGKSMGLLLDIVTRWAAEATDIVSVMLVIIATEATMDFLEGKTVDTILPQLIQVKMVTVPRFSHLLDQHIRSIPVHLPAAAAVDPIVHRSSKLLVSLLSGIAVCPGFCPQALQQFISHVDRFIVSARAPEDAEMRGELRLVCMATSYHHLIVTLEKMEAAHASDALKQTKKYFADRLRACIEALGVQLVARHCSAVEFVAEVDSAIGSTADFTAYLAEAGDATQEAEEHLISAVRDFKASWRTVADRVLADVQGYFVGGAGGLVFRSAWSALLKTHGRLASLARSSGHNMAREMVPARSLAEHRAALLAKLE